MRTIFKIVGTAGVVVLLSYPLWAPRWGRGILGDIAGLSPPGTVVLVAAFFGLVALYCRTLQRTLTLVRPDARTTPAAYVWRMFAIPFNFIEDFFIVGTVGTALAADAYVPARELHRWSVLGYGWCGLQLLSLFPGIAGYLGGIGAMPVWVAHWVMTVRINRRLADRTPAATLATG
ncbi:hypothetical protein EV385_1101 [Krasilnikovia cinnamomea]|uniref:Uncharacterized protein n=1 Tax=Krasilnikovia cinnamomea TaxID=349313 RepID=A0A4Q7ZGP0_9ACTN|nr:hypothetical protein [Krasilnikovia cinnamomea]RZU49353.1 hypothetical protein EV385_1101 [Krasilnikovia cinnamomea]